MKILIRIGMAGMLACGMLSATTAATSTSLAVTVSVSAGTTSTLGQAVTLTANVVLQSDSSAVTSGYVTFFSGADPVGAGNLNGSGQATFITTLLPAGTTSLRAFYVGATGLAASFSSASAFTVNASKQNGFEPPYSFTTGVGNAPNSVAIGDFNGDGNADLVIANLQGRSVSVLLGDGTGNFTPATGSPYSVVYNAQAVAVGDFNGDGLTDIAVAISGGYGESYAGILLNTSTSLPAVTFGPVANYATGSENASQAIAVGDFNGDGIADLALGNYQDQTVGVTLGKGDGTFPATNSNVTIVTVGGRPEGIVVADLNLDGKADIAVSNGTSNGSNHYLSILINSSPNSQTLSFANAVNIFVGNLNDTLVSVAAADFNGDGYPDFAIGDSNPFSQNVVYVFLNKGLNGPGQFAEAKGSPYDVGTGDSVLSQVIVGDFNGDGVIDIAAVNANNDNISVLVGNGAGGFAVQGPYPVNSPLLDSDFPIALAVADFNGDGVSDIVTANNGNSSVSILLGIGNATSTTLMSAPNPSIFGQSVMLTATVTPTVLTGDTVTFFADAVSLGTGTIANAGGVSSATLSTSALTGGLHRLTATYKGDPGFSASTTVNAVSQTVNPTASTTSLTTAPNPSVAGQGVLLTATVTTGATGTVSFYNNGATLISTQPLNGGTPNTAAYTVSSLLPEPSPNSITAVYNGDINYLTSTSNAISQTVMHTTVTSLSLSSGTNPSAVGQALTFRATVTPAAATGTITFFDGSTQLGVVNLSGGAAGLAPLSTLTAGAHSLKAVYSGDTNDAGSTSTILTQTVKTSSTTSLTAAPNPSVAGQGVLLTATVTTGATGTVSFYNNVSTLISTQPLSAATPNIATFTVSSLLPVPNPNSLTAVYNGDATYVSSSSNAISQTVKNTTVTSLSLSAGTNPSAVGQSLTFKATVTPSAATGTITFFDSAKQLGVVNLSGGAASLPPLSTLAAGAHSLKAVYSGDTNDAASTSTTLTQNVEAASTTTLTAAPNPSVAGQGVLLTATVTTGATGTVSFFNNVSTLISTQPLSGSTPNIATFTVSNLLPVPNPNSITAVYNGDNNFATSTSKAINQLVKNTTVMSLSLSSGTDPSAVGQALTFEAMVTPSTAGGTVTFFDGSKQLGVKTLSKGTASFTTSTAFAAGTHSLKGVYSGDTNDAGSASAILTQNVEGASTTTLTAAPNPAVAGQDVLLTATVTNGATGTVSFYNNVSTLLGTQPVSGGKSNTAALTVSSFLPVPNPNSLTAVYNGDVNYATSTSKAVDLTVKNTTVTSLSLGTGTDPSTPGEALTLKATVTPSSATGTVMFLDGSKQLGSGKLSEGAASLKLSSKLSAGEHSLKAVYGGDKDDAESTSAILVQTAEADTTTALTASPNPSVAGQDVLLTATVTTGATGTVSFYNNVATLLGTQPVSGGTPNIAKLTVSNLLPVPSPNSLTAIYNGDSIYLTSTSKAVKQTVKNTTVTNLILSSGTNPSTVGQTLTFKATVTPSSATGTVTFFDGTKQLGAVKLTAAAASLTPSPKLAAGAHSLKAVYGGDTDDAGSTSAPLTQTVNTANNNPDSRTNPEASDHPASLRITSPANFPTGRMGVGYPAQILTAAGGTPPYRFSIRGAQPNALRLANGRIAGTPGAIGDFGFTLVVTDSAAVPATSSLDATITIEANTPDLILSAAAASFSLAPGASAPPLPNTITVASSVVSRILTFTTSSSVPWLTVSGATSTPGSIEVGLNSAALALSADGSPYAGTIAVTCTSPECAGKSQTIAVSLSVAAAEPQVSLGAPSLSFTALASNPQLLPESLGIVNAGGGSLGIQSVTASANWISVGAFPSEVAPGPGGRVAIAVDPAGLHSGYYSGSVTVNTSAGSASVPVTFLLADSAAMMLAPAGMQFSLPQGGALARSGGAFLVGVSSASASFNASVLPGANWLSAGGTGVAAPASPATVGYSIDASAAAALPAGLHYGTIRVTGSGVVDSQQDFQVVLNVGPEASEIVPDPEEAGLTFIGSGTRLAGRTSEQTIPLFGSSADSIGFQASPTMIDGSGWLSVTPRTGSTSASSPAQISITANPAGLRPGVYRGGVGVAYGSAVRTVNVTLIVPPGASCAGTELAATQTGLVSNFSVSASLPVPLAVQLRDTCGNAIGNAHVVTTFSNGDEPLVLSPVDTANGIYAATWTPRNTSAQMTVLTTASAPGYTMATTRIPGQVAGREP